MTTEPPALPRDISPRASFTYDFGFVPEGGTGSIAWRTSPKRYSTVIEAATKATEWLTVNADNGCFIAVKLKQLPPEPRAEEPVVLDRTRPGDTP